MCARQEVCHDLGDSQEIVARSDERSDKVTNDVTKCGSDSPTVNERLMSRRLLRDNTCSCTVVQSVRHGRRTSVRRITGSTYEKRAVENKGVSVTFQWRTWLETTT